MIPAPLLPQLQSLCRDEPTAPKVIFVPNQQVGQALQSAVARADGQVAGLTCLSPSQYAEQIAQAAIVDSGRQRLLGGGRTFLAADLLADVDDSTVDSTADASLDTLPSPHRFARTVGASVDTLRLGSVVPESVQRRAQAEDASDTLAAVGACYARYVEILEERQLYDDADLFMWAIEQVERGAVGTVDHTVYGVTDATELSECAYRFVDLLRRSGRRFVRLGSPSPHPAPALSAASLFSGAEYLGPAAETRDGPLGTVSDQREACGLRPQRFVRAVGAPQEVKTAVRDLLADASSPAQPSTADWTDAGDVHGLDDAELAYTDRQPYLSLIVDTLDRLGIEATIATGLPGSMTQTGRALAGFFDWIVGGFDPEVLIRLLRSQHLRVDRWMGEKVRAGAIDAEQAMEGHEIATLLAEHRYEEGRHGYHKTLQHVRDQQAKEAERLEGHLQDEGRSGEDRTVLRRALNRTEHTQKRLHVALAVVADLLTLATGQSIPSVVDAPQRLRGNDRVSVEMMAANSQRLIEVFGPVDEPAEEREEERSLEERARQMFYKELETIEDLPVAHTAPARRVAALMQEWVGHQYVPPQRPRPGAVHVVPLESAAYGDRSRLYVVGGDSDTLSTTAVDDAMLRDADRRALSASLEGALPEQSRAADEALWRLTRALERHDGAASFYTRVFDVDSGEDRYPSSLFLRLEADAEAADRSVAGLLPDAEGGLTLTDTEAWLERYQRRRPDAVAGETARERLARAYPWLLHGETARQARRSDRYTEHDGLLAEDLYDELDFLSDAHTQKMSAGRLETLAETPYIYFLRYVLGVEPLDEPALDDEPWMNRLAHGDLLHRTFEAFMTEIDGAAPSPLDQERLHRILRQKVDQYAQRLAPPSEVVREGAMRRLWNDALVFLRAEAERAGSFEALHHELGFGFGPHRRKEGDRGAVTLSLADGHSLRLRGRIDRVDRIPDSGAPGLAIWDYKTGSAAGYDEEEPLQDGQTLQWALYAYALEQAQDEPVVQSGYFFTSTREMGTRLVFRPDRYREEVDAIVTSLSDLARTGTFPMTPDARYANPWKYRGYDRLFPDLAERSRELKAKILPENRPTPHVLR